MNANMAKVQSLIENAFTSAVEKLAKDESGNFISDLYVQALSLIHISEPTRP